MPNLVMKLRAVGGVAAADEIDGLGCEGSTFGVHCADTVGEAVIAARLGPMGGQ